MYVVAPSDWTSSKLAVIILGADEKDLTRPPLLAICENYGYG